MDIPSRLLVEPLSFPRLVCTSVQHKILGRFWRPPGYLESSERGYPKKLIAIIGAGSMGSLTMVPIYTYVYIYICIHYIILYIISYHIITYHIISYYIISYYVIMLYCVMLYYTIYMGFPIHPKTGRLMATFLHDPTCKYV